MTQDLAKKFSIGIAEFCIMWSEYIVDKTDRGKGTTGNLQDKKNKQKKHLWKFNLYSNSSAMGLPKRNTALARSFQLFEEFNRYRIYEI